MTVPILIPFLPPSRIWSTSNYVGLLVPALFFSLSSPSSPALIQGISIYLSPSLSSVSLVTWSTSLYTDSDSSRVLLELVIGDPPQPFLPNFPLLPSTLFTRQPSSHTKSLLCWHIIYIPSLRLSPTSQRQRISTASHLDARSPSSVRGFCPLGDHR